MLSYDLTHPEVLAALARSGHGSQVLISDGNFPHSTGAHPGAPRVWLNLAPGRLTATEILQVVAGAITVEDACVMESAELDEPPAQVEFRALLPGIHIQLLERFDFYAACQQDTLALVIASGDARPFSNILLTQGVRPS